MITKQQVNDAAKAYVAAFRAFQAAPVSRVNQHRYARVVRLRERLEALADQYQRAV